MTLFFNPFSRSQGGNAWFRVGLASSFPNITSEDEDNIAHARPCGSEAVTAPGCKVFYVPKEDSSRANQVTLDDSGAPSEPGSLRDQECPHSSYPLSDGVPFDIEDFGIVLSSGITCPKHGWSFDLITGRGDRGNYRLQVWETELRPVETAGVEGGDNEVWVRRKQRIG
ncbi:hypothetical protein INS49_010766 [Diaporthe citri]|uniref:uncharacterized protein n=1 Tax=Diaporthe citri TaxID=83186 RepID=UPI001C7E41EA|nr:uncharacterized protein INS49_010766 [Diaporthe citri]KAG6359714.1 hypothetical protein INS49_010766 [Diaporthe citri]